MDVVGSAYFGAPTFSLTVGPWAVERSDRDTW